MTGKVLQRLEVSFFAQRTEQVAEQLIGRRLGCTSATNEIIGIITETGAFRGGRKALEVGPGVITIQVFQGANRVICIGTEAAGVASVVTIRCLSPVRGFSDVLLGPERVVRAFRLNSELLNGTVIGSDELWIEGEAAPQIARIDPSEIRNCAQNCVAYFRLA